MYRKRILKHRLNKRYYDYYRKKLNWFNTHIILGTRGIWKKRFIESFNIIIQRMCRH